MNDLDQICYRRNFLSEVIARVDLLNPIEGLEAALPDSLNQSALRTFPVREPRQSIAQELQIGPKQFATKQSEFTEWHFHGRRREKTFAIGPTWIYVSYKQYEKYELLRTDFLEQATAFFREYRNAEPSRLGLRYINQIELSSGDPLDWDPYLNSSMLSIFRVVEGKPRIARTFHNLELAEEDFQVRFQYGMHNPDYPAPIRRKRFVLDLDAYRQGHFEPAELESLLDRFHRRIQEIFEHSITNRLREVLNAAEGE